MIELTLAEQVWLMVAAPNTGRLRGATLGVTTDVAVFLELLADGAVTESVHVVSPAASPQNPLAAIALERIASAAPARLTHALNAIHPTWDSVTQQLAACGLVTVQERRLRPDVVTVAPEGRSTRREIVKKCRAGLSDSHSLDDSTLALLRIMWACDCGETGLSESLYLTDTSVLDQMRAVMADDPLAVRLADSVTVLTGPGTLLSLPHS